MTESELKMVLGLAQWLGCTKATIIKGSVVVDPESQRQLAFDPFTDWRDLGLLMEKAAKEKMGPTLGFDSALAYRKPNCAVWEYYADHNGNMLAAMATAIAKAAGTY